MITSTAIQQYAQLQPNLVLAQHHKAARQPSLLENWSAIKGYLKATEGGLEIAADIFKAYGKEFGKGIAFASDINAFRNSICATLVDLAECFNWDSQPTWTSSVKRLPLYKDTRELGIALWNVQGSADSMKAIASNVANLVASMGFLMDSAGTTALYFAAERFGKYAVAIGRYSMMGLIAAFSINLVQSGLEMREASQILAKVATEEKDVAALEAILKTRDGMTVADIRKEIDKQDATSGVRVEALRKVFANLEAAVEQETSAYLIVERKKAELANTKMLANAQWTKSAWATAKWAANLAGVALGTYYIQWLILNQSLIANKEAISRVVKVGSKTLSGVASVMAARAKQENNEHIARVSAEALNLSAVRVVVAA